uniref:Olfactory receptor 97 n=1 Tax=Aulacocentrum confusum TaxID=2767324 RepID=A0A7G8Z9B6_9HYME|nr:olfactory receptor 97 [Aulacocentrum confusum]
MNIKMRVLKHPRYRLNIYFFKFLGIWPFQSKTASRLSAILYTAIFVSQTLPQVHQVCMTPTQENFMEFFPPVIVGYMAWIKMASSILQLSKTKKLLLMIERDWNELKEGPVFDIMTKAADNGGKLSLYYAILFINITILYLLMPLRPKLWVWLGWQKGPAKFAFPYPLNYWVDSYTYLYAIEIHIIICSIVVVMAIIAIDTMFLVFVVHACSLFSAIR